MREVVIAGIGTTEFGRFPDKDYRQMGREAAYAALQDANVQWKDMEAAYVGNVMAEMTKGHQTLQFFGATGIPIINVETACASGAASMSLAQNAIANGMYDVVMVLGMEKAPKGFIANCGYDRWQMWSGLGANPSYFAMHGHEYCLNTGCTPEHFGKVSVKSHKYGVHNPYAMFRKAVTLEQVMNAPMVCWPLTLLMLCAPNEGAAAVVLMAKDVAKKYTSNYVNLSAVGFCTKTATDMMLPAASMPMNVPPVKMATRAANLAYKLSGIGPEDIDIAELQDTDAPSELLTMERVGFCEYGEAWKMLDAGDTELTGRKPINISGGLLSCGEPLGASSLRQVVFLTKQLRGQCGPLQKEGKVNAVLGHTEGAGGNVCVVILNK